MTEPLFYLASPYTHPDAAVREARFQAVCLAAGKLLSARRFVYSPIAHTHPIAAVAELPTDWAFWQDYDTAIIARCAGVIVLMLDGWETSTGVQAEIQIAEALGLPVEFLPKSYTERAE